MDQEAFDRIQQLFHEAVDLEEQDRRQFLLDIQTREPELLPSLLAMLTEDGSTSSPLDRDIAQSAGHLLGSSPQARLQHRFGPYILERVLGEGGMGVVYLGYREDLGSKAAIKILRDAGLSPMRRARFHAEQKTLAQLQHRSIAQLYDADALQDGTPWFAMEYVEGLTLTQYCQANISTLAERLRLFREVCEAVQHAHINAIIHRDLKPSNILVTANGDVKLLDFGIAKQLDDTGASPDRTSTVLRFMTPGYSAPEQILGDRVGSYTDVYSLGVVLYELLAGALPFRMVGLSARDAERLILEGNPEKPSVAARENKLDVKAGAAAWADLDVLCLTAMQREPDRRYSSVQTLLRDLDHFLLGEPLEARPDGFWYWLGKFARRNRQAVTAAAIIVFTIAGLLVFYTMRLAAARNAAVAEAARTQRVMTFLLGLFEGGDPEVGPSNDMRVSTLVDRGVAKAAGLRQDPRLQAELYRTLGDVYQKLGNLDKADDLLNRALQMRRSASRGESASVAESLVDLSLLRVDQARLEDAEGIARQGLAMAIRTQPRGYAAIAAATEALGVVQEARGAYDNAVVTLEEAVRLRSLPPVQQAELASALFELANVHFYAGHLDESESLTRRALAIHREIYGNRHPLVAEDLFNLGAIQQERGNYIEAEKIQRQAASITEEFYGKDHPKTASGLTMIARALLYQKRFDETTELLNRAVAIREHVYGPWHPNVASTLNEVGNVASMRGQFSVAEPVFQRVVAIYRKAYGGKHYLIGVGLSNLASAYLKQGDYRRAEPLFREGLAMYEQTLPAGHLNIGIAKIKLGRTLLREGRYAEAGAETTAGYEIVSKRTSSSVSWLQMAKEDLAEVHKALPATR